MFNKKLLVLAITSAIAMNAAADETVGMNDVTVTATAFDQQVESITQDQLANVQASDMQDILKTLPGVIVDGNVRYGQRIYIRGLEDKFANITIDGAKQSGQIFHHAGDQFVDASLLKISSVELGPNSALSGPGVVNGAFSYETKDPSDFLKDGQTFGGKVSAGYETARERKKGSVALFSKVNDKLEFVGIASLVDDGTLHLGDGSEIANKESRLESGLLKVVFKANEFNTTKLSYNKYEDGGNRNISGEKAGSDVNNEPYSALHRDTLSLKHEYNPASDLIDLELTVYDNKQYMIRDAVEQNNRAGTEITAYPEREYSNDTFGFDVRNTSIVGMHNLTYGVDFNHEEQDVDAKGLTRNLTTGEVSDSSRDGGKIDNVGLYLQDEMVINALTLTLGARYDDYQLGGIYDGSFEQLSPKMKARYQVSDKLALRTAYGRIFKGPQLGETLTLGSSVVQDADVSPQKGHNVEVGFDYDLSDALAAEDAILSFNVYKTDLDDYSHPTKNHSLVSQGKMEILGTETVLSYRNGELGLNASHTYTTGDQTDSDGVKFEPFTANIHLFKLGANYDVNDEFNISYNAEFVPSNDYKRSNGTRVERDSYNVHDINFTYKPAAIEGATVNLGIANIFDKAYERHTAFTTIYNQSSKTYEVGRNFKLQLSYQF